MNKLDYADRVGNYVAAWREGPAKRLATKQSNYAADPAGNVVEFLNAYHGLCFWDDWADPNYLDALLINPDKKPKQLMLKGTSGYLTLLRYAYWK